MTLRELKDKLQELCYQGCSQYQIEIDKGFIIEYLIDRDREIIQIKGSK